METLNALNALISNSGFPIVCCMALAWYIVKRDSKHSKEIEEIRKSLDNNTNVMKELLFYLKGGEKNE